VHARRRSIRTAFVRIVAGIYSRGARVSVKQFSHAMIRQWCAINKPFFGARSIEPSF
jgi:hypothetical protein